MSAAGRLGLRWVLMRGLTRERGHWGELLDRWRVAFPEGALDAPDLPGCGVRHREPAPTSVADTMTEVRRGLVARGPVVPLSLVGLSLGGMVAVEWLRRHPEEVAGVVLINTSLGGLCPPWRRLQPAALFAVARAFVGGDPHARERRIAALTSSAAVDDALVAAWTALAAERPVTRSNAARQLWAAARYRPPLPASPPPVLVLASGRDRMVHPDCSRLLAHQLGADLREHDGAGHDLPLDAPDWVLSEVASWCARHAPDTKL